MGFLIIIIGIILVGFLIEAATHKNIMFAVMFMIGLTLLFIAFAWPL